MESDFFERFYKDQYETMRMFFEKRARKFRFLARLHQVSLLVTAAVAPIITAISGHITLKILAVGVSSMVAILSGVGRIFRFEDAWMNARATKNALLREATYYHAETGDYANCEDKRSLFVERFLSIIERYNVSQNTRLQE